MRSHRFDIPAGTQTRRGQLLGVQAIEQSSDSPPLVGNSSKDTFTVHSHQ